MADQAGTASRPPRVQSDQPSKLVELLDEVCTTEQAA
ncbi:hypothetical protein BC739_001498 [Kutzneria viridogrisea]|uniref:Transposase n=1 Tax=Kutzneria viridogrisea TaxID=47990 RepID=A0ABR6BBR2_9PSEU|nr:hypothetical protein [Kutzneria viridogrisea]